MNDALNDVLPVSATTPRPAPGRNWKSRIEPFRGARLSSALVELALTAIPLLAGLTLLAVAILNGWIAIYLLTILPTAGFLVRLFMIQHDCGHGSFFPGRNANVWTGRILGIFTLTPFDYWQQSHAQHHAGAGNLDRRGVGDIDTLTVREYEALSFWRRLAYRSYRHPLVMFVIGPTYVFAFENRLPVGAMRSGRMPWLSTMGTNLGLAVLLVATGAVIGPWPTFLVFAPVMACAATVGVWLFYVQHQFEDTYWATKADWNAEEAALYGSSYYDLPQPLQWLTANIGLHHIHHLSSRIPFYRLQQVLDAHPELGKLRRITISESIATVRLVLWDEASRRLISFAHYRAGKLAAA